MPSRLSFSAAVQGKNVAGSLPDFSERLSPMLVKELRQGLRSPLFVWGLIGMNAGLSALVPFTMEDPGEEFLHQVFFGLYCVLVCGLLPMRAAGALYEEIRGETLDTLFLTQLDGWRVVVGKWVAVVAQQLLVTITILPYGIVRYYAGGVDVVMELAWLLVFLLLGVLSAALLAGLSWIRYFLLRAAVMMAVIFASGALCSAVLDTVFSGYRTRYLLDDMYREGGWFGLCLLALPAIHLAFAALDGGACQVGGLMEHQSGRRRWAGMLALLIYVASGLWFWNAGSSASSQFFLAGYAMSMGFLTFLGVAGQALMEVPLPFSATAADASKKNWLRQFGLELLKPGWPGGVLYVCVLALVLAVSIAVGMSALDLLDSSVSAWDLRDWWNQSRSSHTLTFLVAGLGVPLGTLPVPLVIHQWLFRARLPWNFGTYFLILIFTFCLQALIYGLASVLENDNWMKLGCVFPAMSWFLYPSVPHSASAPGNYLNWNYAMIHLAALTSGVLWWQMALLLALKNRKTAGIPSDTPSEPTPA